VAAIMQSSNVPRRRPIWLKKFAAKTESSASNASGSPDKLASEFPLRVVERPAKKLGPSYGANPQMNTLLEQTRHQDRFGGIGF
jgi:hypothetical protein